MKTDYIAEAKRVFSADPSEDKPYCCSYDAAVARCGKIVIQKDLGEWQGDLLYIIKKGRQYSYLCIGYGSCSYCDWFQSIETWEEAAKALEDIESQIEWRDLPDLKQWVRERDWEGTHLWYYEADVKEFIEAVEAL